jgi:hypothetical protein
LESAQGNKGSELTIDTQLCWYLADFLVPFFARLFPPLPVSALAALVIGHLLLHGHTRNEAADHIESQVVQLFETDATLPMSNLLLGFGVCIRLLLSAFH